MTTNPPSPSVAPRPRNVQLSLQGLLTLPRRLTRPPPAGGELPSWGIVPRFAVSLDDMLERRHLPPLGLKDFEEWLLFVQHAPENLYFILWLREYTARYTVWIRSSRSIAPTEVRNSRSSYRTPPATHPPANTALASFYVRAKQTFLTPDAPYQLNVTEDDLAPFHSAHAYWYNSGLPPDPLVFASIASEARTELAKSLSEFVDATFSNVGAPRAICGCIGGMFFALLGSIPPIATSFVYGRSRWWRLLALPGMWFGLWIFISALSGVCMMIYVFGDLRQLRAFEIIRPPPSLVAESTVSLSEKKSDKAWLPSFTQPTSPKRRSMPMISSPLEASCAAVANSCEDRPGMVSIHPNDSGVQLDTTLVNSGQNAEDLRFSEEAPYPNQSRWSSCTTHEANTRPSEDRGPKSRWSVGTTQDAHAARPRSVASDIPSYYSGSSSEYTYESAVDGRSQYDEKAGDNSCGRIQVSDAIYDDVSPLRGSGDSNGNGSQSGWATASFIRPHSCDGYRFGRAADLESGSGANQPADAFDFDGLPPPLPKPRSTYSSSKSTRSVKRKSLSIYSRPSTRARSATASSASLSFVSSISSIARALPARPEPALHLPPLSITRVLPSLPFLRTTAAGADLAPGETTVGRELRVRFALPEEKPPRSMRAVVGRMQTACGPKNAAHAHAQRGRAVDVSFERARAAVSMSSLFSSAVTSPVEGPGEKEEGTQGVEGEGAKKWDWWWSVPAFATPLTPVLSPVVTRAQWEIVVRSALVALLVSVVIEGIVVAIPESLRQ